MGKFRLRRRSRITVRRKGPHSYTEKIEIGKHKKAKADSGCDPHCGGQQVLWLKVEPSIQSLWGDVMEAIVVMDNDERRKMSRVAVFKLSHSYLSTVQMYAQKKAL
jgi:hypothetical protein